jgi:hypothetical protein
MLNTSMPQTSQHLFTFGTITTHAEHINVTDITTFVRISGTTLAHGAHAAHIDVTDITAFVHISGTPALCWRTC